MILEISQTNYDPYIYYISNSYQANFLFLHPLKPSENQNFWGYRKRTLDWKGLGRNRCQQSSIFYGYLSPWVQLLLFSILQICCKKYNENRLMIRVSIHGIIFLVPFSWWYKNHFFEKIAILTWSTFLYFFIFQHFFILRSSRPDVFCKKGLRN